jgi:hypothetical protein
MKGLSGGVCVGRCVGRIVGDGSGRELYARCCVCRRYVSRYERVIAGWCYRGSVCRDVCVPCGVLVGNDTGSMSGVLGLETW